MSGLINRRGPLGIRRLQPSFPSFTPDYGEGSPSSWTTDSPIGTQAGDLLIAIECSGTGKTTDSDWTLLGRDTGSTGWALYSRIANGTTADRCTFSGAGVPRGSGILCVRSPWNTVTLGDVGVDEGDATADFGILLDGVDSPAAGYELILVAVVGDDGDYSRGAPAAVGWGSAAAAGGDASFAGTCEVRAFRRPIGAGQSSSTLVTETTNAGGGYYRIVAASVAVTIS